MKTLILERLKPGINKNVPKIQIGGIAGNASTENLIVLKTWMKTLEIKGLIDTLHAIYTTGKILDEDYRMWFKLNNNLDTSGRNRYSHNF